jgi:hypothetical protein
MVSHHQGKQHQDTKTIGTKKEVWEGKAVKTVGGLTKSKLALNAAGKVVSKAKQALGKQQYAKYKSVMKEHQFVSKRK